MPEALSVCVGVWIPAGARHEPDRLAGGFHFLEHMLFKGTRRRSAFQISAAIEECGGYINAFTAEDHTCIYAQASTRHLPRLVAILADMLRDATLPVREVERERGVIREEILMVLDQPAQRVEELLAEVLYPGHPLGRPITGTLESVDRLTREDLLNLYTRTYAGPGIVLTAAGDVAHERFLELVTETLPQSRSSQRPLPMRKWSTNDFPPPEAIRVEEGRSEQTHLAIGFHTVGRLSPDRFALRLLSVSLGETMSSRLFQKLRERRGLCYSINSSVNSLSETGALVFDAAMEGTRVESAVQLMLAELESVAEKGLSRRELERAREYTLGQLDLHLESPYNFMTWLGESLVGYGCVILPEETRLQIRRVTGEEVQRVAQECLQPGRRALALCGPHPGLERLSRLL